MYTELNKLIEQPTSLNNKIILFVELVAGKVDGYIDSLIASTAFGNSGTAYACKGNDFMYLLVHLLNAYDYSQTQNSAGVTYGETEVFSDYGLEDIRNYFQVEHGFDIVPLFDVFGLRNDSCDPSVLFGSSNDYVDITCLIPN